MVSLVLEQTERSMGSQCQKNDRNPMKVHIQYFEVLKYFLKRDPKSKTGKQIIHVQSTPQTSNTNSFLFFGMQSVVHKTQPNVIGLSGSIEIKKLVIVKARNFRQQTART